MREPIKPYILGGLAVIFALSLFANYYLLTHNVVSTEREPNRIAMKQMPEDSDKW